jgi:hypothetical protein
MRLPAVSDNLTSTGSDIVVSTPQAFRETIERDFARYGKLADLFRAAK